MPDYEKMYFVLYNELTDVTRKLEEVQLKTERMYVLSCDEDYKKEEMD